MVFFAERDGVGSLLEFATDAEGCLSLGVVSLDGESEVGGDLFPDLVCGELFVVVGGEEVCELGADLELTDAELALGKPDVEESLSEQDLEREQGFGEFPDEVVEFD